MKTEQLIKYLKTNAWSVRGMLLHMGRADNCIMTTRIMSRVLSEFDLFAFACTARVVVATDKPFNVYKKQFGGNMTAFQHGIESVDLSLFNGEQESEVFLGVGYGDVRKPPNWLEGWAGHLVNFFKFDGRWHFLDYSIDQANSYFAKRGRQDIVFEPFLTETDQLTGEFYPEERRLFFKREDGLNVEYLLFPDDLSNQEILKEALGSDYEEMERQEEAKALEIVEFLRSVIT